MQKINLRELYPDVYKTDVFVDVAEEVVAAIRGQEQDDAAYERRKFRHKAHYSLNREDGIENDALNRPLTPEEVLEQKLLSLAGVYQPKKKIAESKLPVALTRFLEDYPHVKTVYLHLDNDGPGRMAAEAIQTVISKEYEVKNCPPPRGKDVNDYLCRRLGIPIRGAKGKEQER